MGIELLPSGDMETNKLLLGLATMAFNCLRAIGKKAFEYMRESGTIAVKVRRLRLRTVLLDYIKVACKYVSHAGQDILKFGRNCYNHFIMQKIYNAFQI